jgi:hypothetical protein
VAELAGAEISKRGKPMETHLREVLFFDTTKFRLYNHGFMLRRRTFYQHGIPSSNHELTLKFRSANYAEVAAVDVRPHLPSVNVVIYGRDSYAQRRLPRLANDLFTWLRSGQAQHNSERRALRP